MQSSNDFKDIDGKEYNGFARPIGQWNCRHVRSPIVIGISEPVRGDLPKESVLRKLDTLSREIKDFIKMLYRNTDIPEEQEQISRLINEISIRNL